MEQGRELHDGVLRVVSAESQRINGEWVEGSNLRGLQNVRTVVNACIEQMHELDTLALTGTVSPHRLEMIGTSCVVQADRYPVHAILSVASIDQADDVAEYMNRVFDNDRARYPANKGWKALATHYKSAGKSLRDVSHPFFYFKQHSRMTHLGARILVVADQAREGLNNKPCAIWGCAENSSSIVDSVQRLGRGMRSTHRDSFAANGERTTEVPSAELDRVYIITHEAFEKSVATLNSAIHFTKNMRQEIEAAGAMTIAEYVSSEFADHGRGKHGTTASLGVFDRLLIFMLVGALRADNRQPRWRSMVARVVGPNAAQIRKGYARAYARSFYLGEPQEWPSYPDGELVMRLADATADFEEILQIELPVPIARLLQDEIRDIPTLPRSQLIEWLERQPWGDVVIKSMENLRPTKWLEKANALYRDLCRQNDQVPLDVTEPPSNSILDRIDRLQALLDDAGIKVPNRRSVVEDLVWSYVLHFFSNPALGLLGENGEGIDRDEFRSGGRLDRAEITDEVRSNPALDEQLTKWVFAELVRAGHLPGLQVP